MDEDKEKQAETIVDNIPEHRKKKLMKKFKIKYAKHPKYDELVKEMKRRLKL